MQNIYKLAFVMLLFTLSACAKPSPVAVQVPDSEAERVWQSYMASGTEGVNPFRTQMSLRYGTEGDTRRVTALLWGNSAEEIRLDVNAGIGVNIAKIYENNQLFIVFITRENMAYYHQGTQKPLFNAGVPIPFNLQQLAQIIEGNYSSVFGVEHSGTAQATRDDNSDTPATVFNITKNQFAGNLTLNSKGLPIHWQENNKQGWSLSLSYRDSSTTPYKLSVIHASEGKRVILLVKEREHTLAPFTNAQMQLILPDNTEMRPLVEAQGL